MQDLTKEWLVETQGVVYEADLEELKQWISEAAVLPSDRVKRGGLRWLTIKQVPELQCFISPYQMGAPVAVPTIADELAAIMSSNAGSESKNKQVEADTLAMERASETKAHSGCHFHPGLDIAFVCDVCEHSFCKGCPKSFGGGVKLCPLCDALCRTVNERVNKYRSIGSLEKPYSKADEIAKSDKDEKAHSPRRLISLLRNKLSSSRS